MIATARLKCPNIDSIFTEVLNVDPAIKGNTEGSVVKGNIEERWTARACGREAPFLVTFVPDGKGGTYFKLHEEAGK
jgi:hypothetical protein